MTKRASSSTDAVAPARKRARGPPPKAPPSSSSGVSSAAPSSADIEDLRPARHAATLHHFSPDEVVQVRRSLLAWYDVHKRPLPWRTIAADPSVDEPRRAYAVWVSEIMSQQTQVATLIPYYERWMAKWPTVEALAGATVEEVNTMWSGLGYYSRGRRLLEGAQAVVRQHGGRLPSTPEALQRDIPGIGPYTAGAIASIVFARPTGVVDGNVVRVLSRLRRYSGDPKSKASVSLYWRLANELVDPARPGDFNQSMMELGAMVCAPQTPACTECPLSAVCLARLAADLPAPAAKDACTECEDVPASVLSYPLKVAKKASRVQHLTMCVVARRTAPDSVEFLAVQRPDKGLLAGLWELPTVAAEDDEATEPEAVGPRRRRLVDYLLSELLAVAPADATHERYRELGHVEHVFSHRCHKYAVDALDVTGSLAHSSSSSAAFQWVSREQLLALAASAALKKAIALWDGPAVKPSKAKVEPKSPRQKAKVEPKSPQQRTKSEPSTSAPRARSVADFFAKATKEA